MLILNHKATDSITVHEDIRTVFGHHQKTDAVADVLTALAQIGQAASFVIATTKNTLSVHNKIPRQNGIRTLHQIVLTQDKELIIISLTTPKKE